MELSGRDSLGWFDDDNLHGLPLIDDASEEHDDVFNNSLAAAPMLDHDDMHALFPMLSDSSFECESDSRDTDAPFESDLSPIFAAKTAPLALLTPRSTRKHTTEKSAFFSAFRNKWRMTEKTPAVATTLSALLHQRCDALSKRLKTKTVADVQQFYATVLSRIASLLGALESHDVDLTNADQVRIAVWCWGKLLANSRYTQECENIASASAAAKTYLAHVLLQSIIRSRRQMLKAKIAPGNTYNGVAPLPVAADVSAPDAVEPVAVAPAAPIAPEPVAPVTPVVHHPLVRKKDDVRKRKHAVVEPTDDAPRGADPTIADATPLKLKRPHTEASFASPAPSQQRHQQLHSSAHDRSRNPLTSQTPPPSAKKKLYIKMRIVPRDAATKALVAQTGSNPKVELKLTSTKRVAEVASHMTSKWQHVRALVPADAALQFYEKPSDAAEATGGSASAWSCWSVRDGTATCLDVWKRSGKKVKNENIVVVYYAWRVLADSGVPRAAPASADVSAGGFDALARSPTSLFAEEVSLADRAAAAAATSASDSPAAASARSLQQFGARVAFRSSASKEDNSGDDEVSDKPQAQACLLASLLDENDDDANGADARVALVDCSPNTQQRLRRRITPMLVATQEFDL